MRRGYGGQAQIQGIGGARELLGGGRSGKTNRGARQGPRERKREFKKAEGIQNLGVGKKNILHGKAGHGDDGLAPRPGKGGALLIGDGQGSGIFFQPVIFQ